MDEDFQATERVLAAACRGFSVIFGICAAMFALAWLLSGSLGGFTLWIASMAGGCRILAWILEPSPGEPHHP